MKNSDFRRKPDKFGWKKTENELSAVAPVEPPILTFPVGVTDFKRIQSILVLPLNCNKVISLVFNNEWGGFGSFRRITN